MLDVYLSSFPPTPIHIKLGNFNRAFIKSNGSIYLSLIQAKNYNIPHKERVYFNMLCKYIDIIIDRDKNVVLWHQQIPSSELHEDKECLYKVKDEIKSKYIFTGLKKYLNDRKYS